MVPKFRLIGLVVPSDLVMVNADRPMLTAFGEPLLLVNWIVLLVVLTLPPGLPVIGLVGSADGGWMPLA